MVAIRKSNNLDFLIAGHTNDLRIVCLVQVTCVNHKTWLGLSDPASLLEFL